MIHAIYRAETGKRANFINIEIMNTPKTKSGYQSVNAVYHLENAVRKHYLECLAANAESADNITFNVVITIRDKNRNPYIEAVVLVLVGFIRGLCTYVPIEISLK